MQHESTFQCERCERVLPLSEFNPHPDYPDKHCHWCRACEQEARARAALQAPVVTEPMPQAGVIEDAGEHEGSTSTPPVVSADYELLGGEEIADTLRAGIESKTCPRCSQTKAVEIFYHDRTRSDGLSIYCKTCTDELNRIARKVRAAEAASVADPEYPPEHKICPRCGMLKRYDDFYNDRRRLDGKSTYCKVCHAEMSKTTARRAQELLEYLVDLVAQGMEDEALMELQDLANAR